MVCRRPLVPVQVSKPFVQMRVVMSNHFHVTFENRVIRYIEADERHVQSYICFGDMCAEQVWVVVWI